MEVMKYVTDQLADEVRALRRSRGLTQSQLAARVGSTRASMSNVERGNHSLSLELFCRIAIALDVSPDELLRRSTSDNVEPRLREVKNDDIRHFIEKALK